MERTKLVLAIAATLVAACEAPSGPRPGDLGAKESSPTSSTTFSGEATVVQTRVWPPLGGAPIAIDLVGTGPLSPSGGALNATLLDLNVSKEQTAGLVDLSARVGGASTVGQGNRSDAQATVAYLSLNVGGAAISAAFLEALASAVCDAAGGAVATGRSTITDLTINGTPVGVVTEPNTVLLDVPAARVVANEQTVKRGAAKDADLTVNALHVTAYAVDPLSGQRAAKLADVVVASAHADVHCGLCTDAGDDFTTGGGWFNASDGPQERKHFAVAGGYKNGEPWGHLTYMDKNADVRIKGDGVDFYDNDPTPEGNRSFIQGHGHLADGTFVSYEVTVEDNGEPGRADKFYITLTSGRTYASGGTLGGGNIQFHGKPSRCAQ
jgi:hypothetical protein